MPRCHSIRWANPLQHMAAAGIALQGHVVEPSQLKTGRQYQYYPATSYYGYPSNGDPDYAGSNIALFAIGLSQLQQIGTSTTVVGGPAKYRQPAASILEFDHQSSLR